MFYDERIKKLEKRIKALEEKQEQEQEQEINIYENFGGSSSTWITKTGSPKKLDRYYLTMSNEYTVSVAYILDLIVRHLGVNIVIDGGTDLSVKLEKPKVERKPRKPAKKSAKKRK